MLSSGEDIFTSNSGEKKVIMETSIKQIITKTNGKNDLYYATDGNGV